MAATIQNIEFPTKPRALDSSGNNNHGKIYSGRALEFDGVTDYLDTGYIASAQGITNDITVACWLRTTDVTISQFVFNFYQSTSEAFGLKINSNTVFINNDIDDASANIYATTILSNTWYRAVVVIDSLQMKLYLNGILVGSGSSTADGLDSFTSNLYIGNRKGSDGANFYTGMMSNVQVWDAVWSADDIAYDYANPESLALNASGTALTEANLKAWYPMQDGHRGQQSYILDGASTDFNTGPSIVHHSENFSTDTTGTNWAVNDASSVISHDSANNLLRVTYEESDGNELKRNSTLTIGKKYKVTFKARGTHDSAFISIGSTGVFGAVKNPVLTTFFQDYEHNFTADSGAFRMYQSDDATAGEYLEVTDIVIKAINDKHHATTVFLGDEMIASDAADNRTFDNDTGNWATYDDSGSDVAISNNSNKLRVVTTTDNEKEGAKLPIAHVGNGTTTSIVAGRTYRVSANLDWISGGFSPPFIYVGLGGALVTAFQIDASDAVYTKDITAINNTGDLLFYTNVNLASTFDIDNVSVKEVGAATGWTDADQQLDIAQPALQSYNELAWFDGVADYCEIADHDDFSFVDGSGNDEAFSVSAWIFMNDVVTFPIITKQEASKQEWFFGTGTDSRLYLAVYDNNLSAYEYVRYEPAMLPNKWYHVAGTYNGVGGASANAGMDLYINGESVAKTLGDQNTYVNMENLDGKVMIGKRTATSPDEYANGVITEVAIFGNRAIGAANVLELYNEGKARDAMTITDASYIVGYWRNNGLSTWTDLSTNSHNGTPTSVTETLLCPQGVDGSRDTQGLIMNRARNTSSLNLNANKMFDALGKGNRVNVENIKLGTTDFSVCFWVYKFRDWDEQWVASQYVDTNNRWYIRGSGADGPNLHVYAKVGGAIVLDDTDPTDLDGAAYLDNWMHVALTVDRSDTSNGIQWYVNGVATSNGGVESGETGTSLSLSSNAVIGANEDINFDDHHFDGKIDGVVIYTNKLLSGPEVLRNYKATKGSHRN